jgi:hypothetical protein
MPSLIMYQCSMSTDVKRVLPTLCRRYSGRPADIAANPRDPCSLYSNAVTLCRNRCRIGGKGAEPTDRPMALSTTLIPLELLGGRKVNVLRPQKGPLPREPGSFRLRSNYIISGRARSGPFCAVCRKIVTEAPVVTSMNGPFLVLQYCILSHAPLLCVRNHISYTDKAMGIQV